MNYKKRITEEFLRRQSRNPSYSLRAYAKSLRVSATTLSEVINGKRRLHRDSIDKVAESLCLLPHEKSEFTLSALGYREDSLSVTKFPVYDDFEVEQFKSVSDWYYFSILSLAKLPSNKGDPEWIALRLGITKQDASEAYARLLRLGLIESRGNGFTRTSRPLFVDGKMPSAAVRKYHRQNLEKSIVSLEQDPVEVRDMSSITMAIDPSKVEEARNLIKEFREKMALFLEQSHQSEVYTLAVQLFPVSRKEIRK